MMKVKKMRDTKKYTRTAINDAAKCMIVPMNRHWKCGRVATKNNEKFKKLVEKSYFKLREKRLEKERVAEEERRRREAEER